MLAALPLAASVSSISADARVPFQSIPPIIRQTSLPSASYSTVVGITPV